MAREVLPRYRYGQVPAGLFTRSQLSQRGLKPGAPACGYLYLQGRHRNVELFAEAGACPKRQLSDAQRAVLRRGRETQQAQRKATEDARQQAREEHFREVEEYRQQREEELQEKIAQDFAASIETAKAWLQLGDRGVLVDCETTGIEYGVEIVELAVVDLAGDVLFHSLVKPRQPIPADAQRVHGITDTVVAAAPSFTSVWPLVRPILAGRTMIAFNASFDRGALAGEVARIMLDQVEDKAARRKRYFAEGDELDPECLGRAAWRCAMQLYAEHVGDWNRRHGSYTWRSLPGAGHRAIGDCRATLALLQSMAASVPRFQVPDERMEGLPHVSQ